MAAWTTVAGIVLVVVLTALCAILLWAEAWGEARARAEAEAARSAIAVRAAIANVLVQVDAGGGPRLSGVQIGELDADGRPVVGVGREGVLDDPAVRTALARARDTASIVVSAPVGETAGGSGAFAIVRARYQSMGEGPSAPPRSTPSRRDAVSGYTIGVVDAASLLPAEDVGGRRITDGSSMLTSFGPRSDGAEEVPISVLDRRWLVAAPVDQPPAAVVWFVVLGGAAAAVVLALGTRSWRRALDRRTGETIRARDRADAVITYAGVVQESHDVGQVIPALAVQLSDRLGLDGVSLSVAGGGERSRDVFVYGDTPDPSVPPAPALPDRAEAGETVPVHLRRAERSIGVLRVLCGRALGPADLDQVHIAAELMTSTVVASRSMEQQQDAVDRLRTLDELKTAFLGTASHELRTPVTAISGFSLMLSERWDNLSESERRVFADRIASNSRALEALVQDLLDFARLERGDLRLVLEPVDLASVANRVLDRLEPVWSSHTIEREIQPGAIIRADVAATERVVTNLVSNAVKFSPAGSPVRVAVEDGAEVRLVVDDEGPGVPARDRERIFVRFFRGEGQAVLRTSGVGIGLSVVKDFVTQMGGRIEVDDNPAGGARFVVRFVTTPAVAPAEEDRDVAST